MSWHEILIQHWPVTSLVAVCHTGNPSGQPLFLTWHLHGSLPKNRFPPPSCDSAGKAFVWMDRYLDEARSGPTWLRKEEIADLVARSIQYAESKLQFYALHAWVIMSNHVHLLVSPSVPPPRFLQSVKGYTAREANRLLQRTGEPFWQAESYDHWVRDAAEIHRIAPVWSPVPIRGRTPRQRIN